MNNSQARALVPLHFNRLAFCSRLLREIRDYFLPFSNIDILHSDLFHFGQLLDIFWPTFRHDRAEIRIFSVLLEGHYILGASQSAKGERPAETRFDFCEDFEPSCC